MSLSDLVFRKPSCRTRPDQLCSVLSNSLTPRQSSGLAFATRDLRVTASRVQSFQIGSTTSGTVKFGGLSRSLGGIWGIYGGVGSIKQETVNVIRTDVQIKVEDPATGERGFLEYALPFAVTLSIDPGETLRMYFAKGGLSRPLARGDFRLDEWTPFAAQDMETGQLLPIGPLPLVSIPDAPPLWLGYLLAAVGLLGLLVGFFVLNVGAESVSQDDMAIFVALSVCPLIGGTVLIVFGLKRKEHMMAFEDAVLTASKAIV